MITRSISHVLNTVAAVVGEQELRRVARKGAYWSSCFWRARNEHPIYLWAYHHIRALDVRRLQGTQAYYDYLHEHNIYD